MNFIKRIRKYVSEQSYYIGFLFSNEIKYSEEERFKSIHWLNLNGYNNGWFADPFFLSVSDAHIELFVEEWEYSKNKGRLCLLDIKRQGREFILENVTPILELDTHLSFPITIVDNNKLYVYPENAESGTLKIYEYDFKKRKLKKPYTIIERPLLDAQIIKQGNAYFLLSVENVSGTQADTKRLKIFKSSSLLGPYCLVQEVNNEQCEERGAGSIIEKDGILYRPTQCCEGDYGKAVIIKKIDIQSNGDLTQNEVERFKPLYGKKKGNGLHSYNAMSGLYVIDGKDYRYPQLSRFIRWFLCK